MWYDEMDETAIDSDDAYAMGLRPARCNGCKLVEWRHRLGDKFLMLNGAVYELDTEPGRGQGDPSSHEERPIRWHFWGMSYGHSDECYNWQPPKEEGERT